MADYDYLGLTIRVDELEHELVTYFQHCADHDFHLQRCRSCDLFRYPPTTACPFCGHLDASWARVEPVGTVHSYSEVHHAIQPGFRAHTPYAIVMVDLDVQKGKPGPDDALRVVGNLVTADGQLAPEDMVRRVGIGSRMRMAFTDLGEGMALPQWMFDESVEQPTPWRYPQE